MNSDRMRYESLSVTEEALCYFTLYLENGGTQILKEVHHIWQK